MSINAIKKPPIACPMMEAISHDAELMAAAEGSMFFGTILAIIDEKVGPENALMAPVIAMMKKMSDAIVQGLIEPLSLLSDKNRKNKMQTI